MLGDDDSDELATCREGRSAVRTNCHRQQSARRRKQVVGRLRRIGIDRRILLSARDKGIEIARVVDFASFRRVEVHAVAGSDDGLIAAEGTPCDTDAGRKRGLRSVRRIAATAVPVEAVSGRGYAVGEQRLASEAKSTARIGGVDPEHLVLRLVRNAAIVPAKAKVERHVVVDFPIVLYVRSDVLEVKLILVAGDSRRTERFRLERICGVVVAEQEVGDRIARSAEFW